MAITGRVDYGAAGTEILAGTPSGCWALIGLDGNHYTQASNGNGAIQVGSAETNVITDTITGVELAADLLAETGKAGAAGQGIIPVPGTPYIGWIGGNFSNEIYGVFYKIDASGLLPLEGGFSYTSSVSPFGSFGAAGQVAAAIEIDGEVYFALNVYAPGTGEPELCIAHIPYTGTNLSGDWDTFSTQSAFTDGFVGSGSRRYYNFVNLKDIGDGVIGVLGYVTPVELGGPVIKYNEVDTVAQTAGALIDLTASFPEVVADAGKLYDGSASVSPFDDYTAPFIDGNTVIWARPFTDNIDTVRLHTYTMVDSGDITYEGMQEISGFTITGVAGDLESVRIYKESDVYYVALVDRRFFYFAQQGGVQGGGDTWVIGL